MKKWLWLLLVMPVAIVIYFYKTSKPEYNMPTVNQASTITMEITSSAFQNGSDIPQKYTCQGENINPPLEIKDIPAETKSFALIMDDPDATNGTFVHWVVWNINPGLREVPENSVPDKGFEAENGAGKKGYIGPCPPSGKHRYFFKLYALDIMFTNFPEDANLDHLMPQIEEHSLAQAELMGLYQKK